MTPRVEGPAETDRASYIPLTVWGLFQENTQRWQHQEGGCKNNIQKIRHVVVHFWFFWSTEKDASKICFYIILKLQYSTMILSFLVLPNRAMRGTLNTL